MSRGKAAFFDQSSVFEVDVQIFEEFASIVSDARVRGVVSTALASESADPGSHVSAVIADDEVVRELNRLYRGLDENTDVLAFSFTHEGEYYGEEKRSDGRADVDFALPPACSGCVSLGEIIISYPQTRRQAEQAGHAVERELTVLLLHGVLHLLGYDHEESDDAALMVAAEARAMEKAAHWEHSR